jgi:hypothetical protein
MAFACNPSYLGGWDLEDPTSWQAQTNSPIDPILKMTRAKWTEGVAQVGEQSPEFKAQVLPKNIIVN